MTNPRLQTACDALGWKLLEPMGDGQPRIDVGWGAFEVGHPALVGPMLEAVLAKKYRLIMTGSSNGFDGTCWDIGEGSSIDTIPFPRVGCGDTLADAVLSAFLEVFGNG